MTHHQVNSFGECIECGCVTGHDETCLRGRDEVARTSERCWYCGGDHPADAINVFGMTVKSCPAVRPGAFYTLSKDFKNAAVMLPAHLAELDEDLVRQLNVTAPKQTITVTDTPGGPALSLDGSKLMLAKRRGPHEFNVIECHDCDGKRDVQTHYRQDNVPCEFAQREKFHAWRDKAVPVRAGEMWAGLDDNLVLADANGNAYKLDAVTVRRLNGRPMPRALELADKLQAAEDDNRALLVENAKLRRELERLERKAGKR